MAIHHDKTAYGKLASAREDLSEERVLEMLRLLSETSEKAEETEKRNFGTIEKTDREPLNQPIEKTDREPLNQPIEKANRAPINQPAALAPSVESGAAKPASAGQPAPSISPLPRGEGGSAAVFSASAFDKR